MLETIYIARHGFRSNWVDASITTSVTKTQRDPPLASYGLEQSEHLANWLSKSTDEKDLPVPELIFSSPFYRCVQTASYLARSLNKPIMLEHGVQEWYSTARAGTGLHPRPGSAAVLQQYFPDVRLDQSYSSTVYPSRQGETMAELQARCDLFVNTWVKRIETEYPEVKTVCIFAHAASVIALGRSLTGNRDMEVVAGCASTSKYNRKTHHERSGGVGSWTCEWDGRADYLPNGIERNWSFKDVVLTDAGEVIEDEGDGRPFSVDELTVGIAPGLERYHTVDASPEQDVGQSQPTEVGAKM